MTPAERASAHFDLYKAEAPRVYNVGDVTITCRNARLVGAMLVVDVVARRGGTQLDLGDGVFQFVNPPLMVPDGSKSTVRGPRGASVQRDNMRQDVDAAHRAMILDAAGKFIPALRQGL